MASTVINGTRYDLTEDLRSAVDILRSVGREERSIQTVVETILDAHKRHRGPGRA